MLEIRYLYKQRFQLFHGLWLSQFAADAVFYPFCFLMCLFIFLICTHQLQVLASKHVHPHLSVISRGQPNFESLQQVSRLASPLACFLIVTFCSQQFCPQRPLCLWWRHLCGHFRTCFRKPQCRSQLQLIIHQP